MDFANERYVRLYTRETTTWRLLSWQGQALMAQLIRLADRAGVIDLAGVEPWEAVAAALPKWPTDVVKAGVDDLAQRSIIEIGGDALVLPRYIEAQETASSDAQRARDYREKRRDSKRAVTPRHAASHTVTPAVPNQPNQAITPCSPPKGDALISGVLEAMETAMRQLNPKAQGPRDNPENRKRIRKPVKDCGATLGDWQTVIRRQLVSVRGDRAKWKYLSLQTLGRPQNFQRLLDAVDDHNGTKRPPPAEWQDDDDKDRSNTVPAERMDELLAKLPINMRTTRQ